MKHIPTVVLLSFVAASLAQQLAAQTNVFVSPCPSGSGPCNAIQAALAAVPTSAIPTLVLHVSPGTYAPFTVGTIPFFTEVQILGIDGPSGTKPVIQGTAAQRCITVSNGPKLTLSNLDCVGGNAVGSGAGANGGGVSVTGTEIAMLNVRVSNCVADGNGGGIYIDSLGSSSTSSTHPAAQLLVCTTSNCSATNGGGFFITATSTTARPSVRSCRSELCQATNVGGGFVLTGCSATINGAQAHQNQALRGAGGYLLESGQGGICEFTMIECSATNNRVGLNDNQVFGAGIAITGGADAEGNPVIASVLRTKVEDNVVDPAVTGSELKGGGIWIGNQAIATLDYCVVARNIGHFGGGIFCDAQERLGVFNSQIFQNEAIRDGFFLFGGDGGGILVEASSEAPVPPEFINVLIVENEAAVDGGGACLRDVGGLFQTCTVVANTAGASATGGLAMAANTNGRIDSCLMQHNTGLQISNAGLLTWSNVVGGFSAAAVNPNPQLAVLQVFASTAVAATYQPRNHFYLQNNSVCINAGNPAINLGVAPYITAKTQTGSPDVGIVDIGFHYDGAQTPPAMSSLASNIPATLSHTDTAPYTFTLTASPVATPGTSSSVAIIFGSASPLTLPLPVGGINLPLTYDAYTQALLVGSLPIFTSILVPFDPVTGTATFQFQLPPNLPAPVVAQNLTHAACVFDIIPGSTIVARAPSQALPTLYQ